MTVVEFYRGFKKGLSRENMTYIALYEQKVNVLLDKGPVSSNPGVLRGA